MARNIIHPNTNSSPIGRARTMRAVATVASLAAFVFLAVAFGWQWKPYIQFPAGLVLYFAVEWFRREDKKIKALNATLAPSSNRNAERNAGAV